MQFVPLVPGWAKALSLAAVPLLLALVHVVPPAYAWVPFCLAFVAAYFTGQALPAPQWAAGKPAVQGPLVPLLATVAPLLVAFAHSLAPGLLQLIVYGAALVASGLAGLASPEPLTAVPLPAGGPVNAAPAEGCSLADAAQGKCSL